MFNKSSVSVLNLNNIAPVSDQELEKNPVFKKMQGNILKGHGRDFSVNIFLEFSKEEEPKTLKKAISKLAIKFVTSAYQQYIETKQYNQFKIPGKLFGSFFLSSKGYKKLGHNHDRLKEWFSDEEKFPSPGNERFFVGSDSFIRGMKASAEDLGDIPAGFESFDPKRKDFRLSPLQKKFLKDRGKLSEDVILEPLERAYDSGSIDAMLLLADDDEGMLLRKAREVISELDEKATLKVIAVEIGKALRNNEGEGIEHFGYVDGRSQPLFLASDFTGLTLNENGGIDLTVTKEKTNDKADRREGGDINKWNPFAPLNLVLKQDTAIEDPEAFGSYFVFRKLEQDVLRFAIAEQQLADELKLQGNDRERAGAMIVGRFRDGTPLVHSQTDGFIPAKENNFRYDENQASDHTDVSQADSLGLKCPFQAHIRKTNPRESSRPEDEEKDLSRRIIRRGITYGDRNKHPNAFQALDELPTGDVGLLFACFQKSIVNQYAFMQKTWANNIGFKQSATGLDPLIGQVFDTKEESRPEQNWRKEYGSFPGEHLPDTPNIRETHRSKRKIDNFVQFRGGEFFFAPSISFFQSDFR